MTREELQAALTIFALGERATMKEIKARHRELVKQYHPDAGAADPERIREVNAAYQVLLAYLESYLFSFNEEEFYRQNPEQRLQRQFGSDPLWGKG
jgi:curved DNA-binding protein CbpA